MAIIDVELYNSLVSGYKTDKDIFDKMSVEVFRWINCEKMPTDDEIAGNMVSSIAAISRIHEKNLCSSRLPSFCLIRLVKRDLGTYIEKLDETIQDINQNYCDNIDRRHKIDSVRKYLRNMFIENKDHKYSTVNAMTATITNN